MKIGEGEQVTCSNCNAVIATARTPINHNEVVSIGHFVWVGNPPWLAAIPVGCICDQCGGKWARVNEFSLQLHTKDGWQ